MVSLRKSGFQIAAAFTGVLVIILFLFYAGDDVGIDSEVMEDSWIILPGLVLTIAGIILVPVSMVKNRFFVVPACGAIGVGFAILLGEMNTVGWVVDKWVTDGFALIGLQGFFIVISIVAGAFLTVRT